MLTTREAAGFIAGGLAEGNMDKKETLAGTYEVLTGFCIGNAVNVWPGEEVELTEAQARHLLGHGWVRKAEPKPAKPAGAPGAAVRERDPKAVRNQDPK